MGHATEFLDAVSKISAPTLELAKDIERLADALSRLHGRLFILGVGGSAANASHAAADFRKLCAIEAYAPTDSVAEITARTNDEGWNEAFVGWLKASHMDDDDALLVLSVGGGSIEKNVSVNLCAAIDYAIEMCTHVYAIIGRKDGYAATRADIPVTVPEVAPEWITPLSESFQSVILHCLVSHPKLQKAPAKW